MVVPDNCLDCSQSKIQVGIPANGLKTIYCNLVSIFGGCLGTIHESAKTLTPVPDCPLLECEANEILDSLWELLGVGSIQAETNITDQCNAQTDTTGNCDKPSGNY